jgi:hypothetical protein
MICQCSFLYQGMQLSDCERSDQPLARRPRAGRSCRQCERTRSARGPSPALPHGAGARGKRASPRGRVAPDVQRGRCFRRCFFRFRRRFLFVFVEPFSGTPVLQHPSFHLLQDVLFGKERPVSGAPSGLPVAVARFRRLGFDGSVSTARFRRLGFDGSVSTARFRRLGCRCSVAAALYVLQASSPPVRIEHRKEKGHRPAEQVSGRGGPESREFGIGGGRDRVSVRIRQRIGPRPRPARRPLWPER